MHHQEVTVSPDKPFIKSNKAAKKVTAGRMITTPFKNLLFRRIQFFSASTP